MLTSIKGDSIACLAAFSARSSPDARPIPINAEPALLIIALTSAKSRLISPFSVISSLIPCTPWRKTSSAILNVSSSGVRRSIVWSRRSLGIVIRVSTVREILPIPHSALRRRLSPSKLKGRVTTPTVSTPRSLAICETIGAAPEPVPPPAPKVMNAISEPSSDFLISSTLSLAAASPTLGSAPAPSPRVVSLPI